MSIPMNTNTGTTMPDGRDHAPTPSPVDTSQLTDPPVKAEDAPRATVVVTCTAPAAPPPAIAASDHFSHGLMS